MDYRKHQMAFGCLLPFAVFAATAAFIFHAMYSSAVGFGLLTIGAPLLMGFLAAIVTALIGRPFQKQRLTQELKDEQSRVRIGGWTATESDVEFHAAVDGIWFNNEKYYWSGSLFLNLESVTIETADSKDVLVFKISETLGRGPRYFDVRVPVPEGHETEAREIAQTILEENHMIEVCG